MSGRHMAGCASTECRICGDPMNMHAELNITRSRFHAAIAADCDCELGELRSQRDELVEALEQIQKILGITDTFIPLGAALDCAPIIRAALQKEGKE